MQHCPELAGGDGMAAGRLVALAEWFAQLDRSANRAVCACKPLASNLRTMIQGPEGRKQ